MIYGQPRLVSDPAERLAGLRCIAEHVAPGQWDYARQPSRKELTAVRLLALSLDEASVKIRTGPPDAATAPTPRWACGRASCRWPPPGSSPSPTRPSRPASPSPPTSAPAPVPAPTGVPAASQEGARRQHRAPGCGVETGPVRQPFHRSFNAGPHPSPNAGRWLARLARRPDSLPPTITKGARHPGLYAARSRGLIALGWQALHARPRPAGKRSRLATMLNQPSRCRQARGPGPAPNWHYGAIGIPNSYLDSRHSYSICGLLRGKATYR